MSQTISNSSQRVKDIQKKEKKLLKTQEKILLLNDSISKVQSQLKEKRENDKSSRVSNGRLLTHTKILDDDIAKRPADRNYDIRTYTKLDKDLWFNPDVTNWFNKDAQPSPDYEFSAIQSGYSIAK
jgi:hypothetical protein